MCSTKLIFHFSKSNLAEGIRTEALLKLAANITDMPCSSHPAERHVFVLFRAQAKKQLYCRGRFPWTEEKSNSTQPHHTLNLNPQSHASPPPHSSTHQEPTYSDVHGTSTFSLHAWVTGRLPAPLSRPWLCIMQAAPTTCYSMVAKQ